MVQQRDVRRIYEGGVTWADPPEVAAREVQADEAGLWAVVDRIRPKLDGAERADLENAIIHFAGSIRMLAVAWMVAGAWELGCRDTDVFVAPGKEQPS